MVQMFFPSSSFFLELLLADMMMILGKHNRCDIILQIPLYEPDIGLHVSFLHFLMNKLSDVLESLV